MRLNDEELELVSIARGQNIDEMVAVIEHIAAARVAAALEAERVRLGMTALTRWPLRWPLNLFCSHPSTSGLVTERGDGSWREDRAKCLRCGRPVGAVRSYYTGVSR